MARVNLDDIIEDKYMLTAIDTIFDIENSKNLLFSTSKDYMTVISRFKRNNGDYRKMFIECYIYASWFKKQVDSLGKVGIVTFIYKHYEESDNDEAYNIYNLIEKFTNFYLLFCNEHPEYDNILKLNDDRFSKLSNNDLSSKRDIVIVDNGDINVSTFYLRLMTKFDIFSIDYNILKAFGDYRYHNYGDMQSRQFIRYMVENIYKMSLYIIGKFRETREFDDIPYFDNSNKIHVLDKFNYPYVGIVKYNKKDEYRTTQLTLKDMISRIVSLGLSVDTVYKKGEYFCIYYRWGDTNKKIYITNMEYEFNKGEYI